MPVDLSRILKGRINRSARVFIYGFEGVGKTSFAAGSPSPFFIDANKGSSGCDVSRVFVQSWEDTLEWTDAAEHKKFEFQTLVFDVVSDIESTIHTKLFQNTTVTKYEGGYGKGDDVVTLEVRKWLAQLERIWLSGKNVILVSHAKVKSFKDPTGPDYDRFVPGCRGALADLLKGWADYVLFAREGVTLAGTKGDVKATTTGERWIYTKRTPAYDAKARGTSMFPEKLPLSWDEFQKAIDRDGARGVELRKEIDAMLAEIDDPAYSKPVLDYLKRCPAGLVDAHNRVQIRLNAKREAAAPATSDGGAVAQSAQPTK